MTSPMEITKMPASGGSDSSTALRAFRRSLTPQSDQIVSTSIISQTPPNEIVNTTTTTSTITDANGKVKKLKTTTTTTLRTTTTVRRVCMVGPGGQTSSPPSGTELQQEAEASGYSSALPTTNETIRLTRVADSGNSGSDNITQVTFMKPQTSTSEVVEVHTDGQPSFEGDSSGGDSCGTNKKTTKTIRKRVTTSVSAVFAARHTKVDGKGSPHPLKGARIMPVKSDALDKMEPDDGMMFFEDGQDLSDDGAAIRALRECERLFASRLALTGQAEGSIEAPRTIVDRILTTGGGSTTTLMTTTLGGGSLPSMFDGLPLYQGYGMISQHTKDIVLPEGSVSVFFSSPLDRIDVGSLTKMFEEATRSSLLTNEFNHLFGDLAVSDRPAIEGSGVEIDDVTEQLENEKSQIQAPTPPARKVSSVSARSGNEDADGGNSSQTSAAEHATLSYKNQILNQLNSKTGPCRMAWSEMPEVQSGLFLNSMTRHEIQLQEAMFEVITSEASYYRSLRVLIEHFYSAPEFECSRSASSSSDTSQGETTDSDNNNTTTTTNNSITNNTNSQSSENSTPGMGSGTPGPNRSTRASSVTLGSDQAVGSSTPSGPPKAVISPTEKHHLFSNVLLICMASERFLRDLEERWCSKKPRLNEICDLIVKHAGSVYFDPYLTYLRNQTYQIAAYHRLNQREEFAKAIARLHSNPAVGKNHLDSFLALPMQRLTRLKLLVEVIQKLQILVKKDLDEEAGSASITGSTETMTPVGTELGGPMAKSRMKVTPEQQENAGVALRELKRLLSESESGKKLMDEKARLLALSTALDFPENVKRIAISDKRLIKEGELKCGSSDGKAVVLLKKLGRKKPESVYLILFNDLLMVTKRKKAERFVVQDYCPRDKIYVTITNPHDPTGSQPNLPLPRSQTVSSSGGSTFKRPKRPSIAYLGLKGGPRHHTTTPDVPEALFRLQMQEEVAEYPLGLNSFARSSTTEVGNGSSSSDVVQPMSKSSNSSVYPSPTLPPPSSSIQSAMDLKRSGSSLSSKSAPGNSQSGGTTSAVNRDLPLMLYVYLSESQSGACSELCLTANDKADYEAWYGALRSQSRPYSNLNIKRREQLSER